MAKKREHWTSSFGFVMAAAGSAIGLGTLWQFPYMTGHNGGGLFVILFLIFTLIIGIPVFIAELLLGRRAQRGVVGIFINLKPEKEGWQVAGWLSVLSPIIILSYYFVVSGWGVSYILMSLTQFYKGLNSQEIAGVFDTLYRAPGLNLFWQAVFTLMTVGVVVQGVRKGIEYWSRILMPALLLMLLGLLAYSCTLSGFSEAVHFVFYPDLAKLKPSGILEALGLAFFTLSLGQGVMLTYGSYMSKEENIPKTALLVAMMNIVVSVLAALMIFPIIFTFGFKPEAGFGLIFQTLPALFAKLPGSLILSVIFFVLFVFTALTSSVAILEVIVANFMDLYQWSRRKSTIISAGICYIVGIPCALSGSKILFPTWELMYGHNYFATMVDLVSSWILPLAGLLVSLFAGWCMKREDLYEEFASGTEWTKTFLIWRIFTKWLAPASIILIMLQKGEIIDIDRLFQLLK